MINLLEISNILYLSEEKKKRVKSLKCMFGITVAVCMPKSWLPTMILQKLQVILTYPPRHQT